MSLLTELEGFFTDHMRRGELDAGVRLRRQHRQASRGG
jgi:hypothetical protein